MQRSKTIKETTSQLSDENARHSYILLPQFDNLMELNPLARTFALKKFNH